MPECLANAVVKSNAAHFGICSTVQENVEGQINIDEAVAEDA